MQHRYCSYCGLYFLASGFTRHRRMHFERRLKGHDFEPLPKFSDLSGSGCRHCSIPEEKHDNKKPGNLDVTGPSSN